MKISTRLILLISLASLLLIGVGGMGLYGMASSNAALETVYVDRTVPAGQIGNIKALLLESRLTIASVLTAPSAERIKTSTATVETQSKAIDTIWAAYMATKLTTDEERLAKDFIALRKAFDSKGVQTTLAALNDEDVPEARKLLDKDVPALYAPLVKVTDALLQLQLDEAKNEFDAATVRYTGTLKTSIMVILLGIGLAIAFGYKTVRTIMQQLGAEPGEAADVAKRVGAGDLSTAIAVRHNDTGSLIAQLKAMQANLTHVVFDVRQGAENIATASAQIAQGNQDLSVRTENQASALQETTAAMEQLGLTVKRNADSARQANQMAQNATSVAAKGGAVVNQVVETMKGINDASRKIADIINVIDSIAFQTNILALNAAVEAARAGEQGRGFAVVASEVRNLAGRSAEAAKEIKQLINDSVERVEQGTLLTDQAGTTMAEVVTSIRSVTDIMGEMSASSGEQSDGVSQISTAVALIDQATQQNAALVEEMAAAASSMNSQADELVSTVSIFRLSNSQQVSSAKPKLASNVSKTKSQPAPQRNKPVAKTIAKTIAKPFAKAAPKLTKLPAPMPASNNAKQPSPPVQKLTPPAVAASSTEDWESF